MAKSKANVVQRSDAVERRATSSEDDLIVELRGSVLPIVPSPAIVGARYAEMLSLDSDLGALRSKVEEIQEKVVTNEQYAELKSRVQEVAQLVDQAKGRGEELKARVLLPPEDDMTINLVPSHLVERLGEYHLENSIAFLLLGLFLGAGFGIMVNWVTNEKFVITNVSLVLMGVFILLAIGSGCGHGIWVVSLQQ